MAQVYPFRAFRYNPALAPFDRVLTQPYDKISPVMQEKYYAADPHNLITVEKGRAYPGDTPQNNVYTRAATALEEWIRKSVVTQDPAAAFYAYTQEYTVPGTEEGRTRRGLFGACGFPARAYAFRSEGGPPGTSAAHEDAHGPAFHPVFGSAAAHRCDSGGGRGGRGARH